MTSATAKRERLDAQTADTRRPSCVGDFVYQLSESAKLARSARRLLTELTVRAAPPRYSGHCCCCCCWCSCNVAVTDD